MKTTKHVSWFGDKVELLLSIAIADYRFKIDGK